MSFLQGSHRLWNSGKTMEFRKGNSIYGKTMEFEENGRTYGKTMEFSFWWEKVHAFFKKWGKNTSGLRNLVLMFRDGPPPDFSGIPDFFFYLRGKKT